MYGFFVAVYLLKVTLKTSEGLWLQPRRAAPQHSTHAGILFHVPVLNVGFRQKWTGFTVPYQQRGACTYDMPFHFPESSGEENPHEDYAVSIEGDDLSREYVVQLSFEDAALGTTRYVSLKVAGICDKCDGSRSEMGYGGNVCPYCEGSGQETVRTGHIVARRACSYCNGEKIFIRFKCIECEGVGRKIYRRDHRLDFPPGVVHGQVLRFPLEPGQLGLPFEEKEGGQRERYLYVTVSVAESPVFSTDGLDLVSNLELSPGMALLGGRLTVKGKNSLLG